MTRAERAADEALNWHRSVKLTLLYVLRGDHGSIDVNGEDLDRIKRLARWWGVAIETKALGYGGYRVSRPRAQAAA
jgi:hypothetical protein